MRRAQTLCYHDSAPNLLPENGHCYRVRDNNTLYMLPSTSQISLNQFRELRKFSNICLRLQGRRELISPAES